jgi:hypothetical protein
VLTVELVGNATCPAFVPVPPNAANDTLPPVPFVADELVFIEVSPDKLTYPPTELPPVIEVVVLPAVILAPAIITTLPPLAVEEDVLRPSELALEEILPAAAKNSPPFVRLLTLDPRLIFPLVVTSDNTPEVVTALLTAIFPEDAAVSVSEKVAPVDAPLTVTALESVTNTFPVVLALRLDALARILALEVPTAPEPEVAFNVPVVRVPVPDIVPVPLALKVIEPVLEEPVPRLAFTAIAPLLDVVNPIVLPEPEFIALEIVMLEPVRDTAPP